MSEKIELVQKELRKRSIDTKNITEIILNNKDLSDALEFTHIALSSKRSNKKIIEASLTAFFKLEKDLYAFDLWSYALGHFIPTLWKMRNPESKNMKTPKISRKRSDKWLRIAYRLTFSLVRKFGQNQGSRRLIDQFGEYSRWNDEPKLFGITNTIIQKTDPHFIEYSVARIKMGKFGSEKEFNTWKKTQPKEHEFELIRH